MMRKSQVLFTIAVIVSTLFLIGTGTAAAQQKLVTLNTCWMPEFETYIPWKAIKEGWDKAEGIELKMQFYDSGMAQMEALPAKQWVLGCTGGVPMLVGALRHSAYMIGIGDDESWSNVVMVRADSPIFKAKGANPKFPEVYGSAETVKGKTILVTTVSSVHYLMSAWLKVLGLKDTDVVVKNMDQAQAVAAFDSGIGDVAVIWAPFQYTGYRKGWKTVADGSQVGANIPLVVVGAKEFCDTSAETVAKFMRVFFKGIDLFKKEGTNLAADYQKFLKEWGGLDMSLEDCKLEIEKHPVFDVKQQVAMFDSSKGPSQVQGWMQGIADFFAAQGRFKPEERDKVMKSNFINDKFLKMIAK